MPTPTAARRLLDVLLNGGLEELVRERRGQGVPWRLIAREIHERTGEDVLGETLRLWFGPELADPDEAQVEAAE